MRWVLFFLSCCWVVVVEVMRGCNSTMIEVGGQKGWVVGAVNYSEWAQANLFLLGDSLVFSYYKQYHNVVEVDEAAYETCNTTAPIASYDDGSTVLTLDKTGHYYFLCGFSVHCISGQKLHIFVTNASLVSPIPSPSPSPSSSSNDIGANRTISSPSLAPTSSATTTLAYSSLFILALLSFFLPLFPSIFFSPQHT